MQVSWRSVHYDRHDMLMKLELVMSSAMKVSHLVRGVEKVAETVPMALLDLVRSDHRGSSE
jgi:hypothetical protein